MSKIVLQFSSFAKSTKKRGSGFFVCRCRTFTTCSTVRLKFSKADFISSQADEGWRLRITTLKGFSLSS